MQHWHIFRKWNERLFLEMRAAYKQGRSEVDPSISWYKGEIGFFDYYIIPLAKKLKQCGAYTTFLAAAFSPLFGSSLTKNFISGVFGVSSDEYLNYAMQNRRQWEEQGESVIAEMINNAEQAERTNAFVAEVPALD
jgi:hypothetical protein